jgi:hypothetical protein
MFQTNIMMLGLFNITSLKQYVITSVYDFNLYQGIFVEIFSFFFFFKYLVCNQIWLNYFLNDHHFGYITKSLQLH